MRPVHQDVAVASARAKTEGDAPESEEYAASVKLRMPYVPVQCLGAAECSNSVPSDHRATRIRPARAELLSKRVPCHRQHLLGGWRIWLLSDHHSTRPHSARYGLNRNARF